MVRGVTEAFRINGQGVRGEEGGEGDGMTGGIAGGEEISPMQDGRTNKQGKIELLSQWMLKG